MNLLYCIKHGKMVKPDKCPTGLYHYFTVQVNNSPDPGTRYDVVECAFPMGWATAPIPEFDTDAWLENTNPYLEDVLPAIDYDVQVDQVIMEVTP